MGIKKRKSKKGFTVIEAIISLVLFTLIMIPLGSFTLTAVKTSAKSATKEQAINAGQGALEQLKTIKLSQLKKIDSDANYSESHKATLKLGNLNVIKTKDDPIYKVEGEYVDPNNKKKFNIDGDITQEKLEDNGESDKEHTLDKKEPKKNYVVYIGESLITVYKIVSKENILKKYIDNNTIKIIDDKDNDLEEAKIVNGNFKGSSIKLRQWLLIKHRELKNNGNEITTLFIDENSNGEINIKAENEEKGEELSTPDSTSEERKKLVKILNEYTDDFELEDGEKKTDIMVYFYRSYANKKIDLKVSNKCLGSQLNIYTCKNEGSGIRYNIYTSTENPHGDISVFKNYIEGNSEDLRGQLFNINLKVKEKDEVLYNLNTTEFIGG
ncbi:prepilin-type N-terminal cleavage/methylation domain-containing protein [Clostridium perfringens]|uniref:type IV pilus modification PilV family protein n=1 Tax=Clostridium perfringens TaxID=1502 RepID=UPI002A16D5D0|nr:prepilin-type N-terminal cleavage/methylation domain-containing protein [Clostridium perfringens]MDM0975304.1 prepilin-type N-terminal cleavage/methylation domain-containing protein [Clostridium perfringens]MDM1000823.1 prepilin-type N-terminal cleavage/methylation domain-containing protein [Clostridium perfringens]